MMMERFTAIFQRGVDEQTKDPDATADAKAWLKKIETARDFDKAARKQYAMDRRYARGDAGQFEVDVPIAGAYIDVLKSFLYAKDPDLDVRPSPATEPPPLSDVIDLARKEIEQDPEALQAIQQAGVMAGEQAARDQMQASMRALGETQVADDAGQQVHTPPPVDPEAIAAQASEAKRDELAKARAEKIMAPYRQRKADAKQFGQTLEIVISRLWQQGRLKNKALPQVGSGLTVGVGWLKVAWQESHGENPEIRSQIDDLETKLTRIAQDIEELAEGEAADAEAQRAELQQQIEGLTPELDVLVARGLGIDFEAAENIQVAPGYTLSEYLEAPWIAHRIFMPVADAKAAFPDVADQLKSASVYYSKKPEDPTQLRDVGAVADVDARDADAYARHGDSEPNVCVWEVWNKQSGMVLTLIDGLSGYAKAPFAPTDTRRFYPFFLYSPIEVDGERHPQSLVSRSYRLLDEYNRSRSRFAEHRRRAIPKLGFDATNYDPTEINKLEAGATGEMVGLKPLKPGDPIANALVPIQYNRVDMGLYDTAPIRAELEMIWGIQEALASSIHVAKTAHEAEIQQQGTEARNSFKRDALEDMLTDLAVYSAEIAADKLDRDDVTRIAGPWAFWPEGLKKDDLDALVTLDIRAGSTGKPDTVRERQAWATVMPMLQQSIVQVGQLRQAPPDEIANCLEELVAETLARTGDRLDVERFLPDGKGSGQPQFLSPAMWQQGNQPGMPQQTGAQPPMQAAQPTQQPMQPLPTPEVQ